MVGKVRGWPPSSGSPACMTGRPRPPRGPAGTRQAARLRDRLPRRSGKPGRLVLPSTRGRPRVCRRRSGKRREPRACPSWSRAPGGGAGARGRIVPGQSADAPRGVPLARRCLVPRPHRASEKCHGHSVPGTSCGGCFSVLSRTENQSQEIGKSFGAEKKVNHGRTANGCAAIPRNNHYYLGYSHLTWI